MKLATTSDLPRHPCEAGGPEVTHVSCGAGSAWAGLVRKRAPAALRGHHHMVSSCSTLQSLLDFTCLFSPERQGPEEKWPTFLENFYLAKIFTVQF